MGDPLVGYPEIVISIDWTLDAAPCAVICTSDSSYAHPVQVIETFLELDEKQIKRRFELSSVFHNNPKDVNGLCIG